MKSIFYRIFTVTVELLAGLVAIVAVAIFASPEILCMAVVVHAPRMLRLFSVLAILTCLSVGVGCSSKHDPEPAKPAEIHWRGPATGYEDTTKPGDQSSLKP